MAFGYGLPDIARSAVRRLLPLSLALLVAACTGSATGTHSSSDLTRDGEPAPDEFVSVRGKQFFLEGKPYYFVGTNFWYGGYLGAETEFGDRERLRRELDTLKQNGITNLRVLAASEQSDLVRAVSPAIVQAPGEYNEPLLKGLDFLLAEMAKREMKAVLYLNNFWQWSGGMSQYVSWYSGEPVMDPDLTGDWNAFMENSARFYSMPDAQAAYRNLIQTLVTRTNSVTGIAYNRDPTIMSWQLANEPRAGSDPDGRKNFEAFRTWIDETAAYIHALAPYQLVSTGNEGAMGSLQDEDLYVAAHSSPHVDYLTFHMWLKNWGWFDINRAESTYGPALDRARTYINRHIDIANEMGKPIVLSEFGAERDGGRFEPGTSTVYRDRIYSAVFELLYQRARSGDAVAGSNFWTWGGFGRAGQKDFMWRPGDDFTGDPPQEHQGLNSVFDVDESTLEVIRDHAEKMHALSGK